MPRGDRPRVRPGVSTIVSSSTQITDIGPTSTPTTDPSKSVLLVVSLGMTLSGATTSTVGWLGISPQIIADTDIGESDHLISMRIRIAC